MPAYIYWHMRRRRNPERPAMNLVSRDQMPIPYPTHPLAFLNNLIHGESSPASSGAQDICTVLNTRSGCSIRIVNRPSAVVSPVIPSGDPLGFSG